MQTIHPMLWFDDQAEEAAKYYVSVFPNWGFATSSRMEAARTRARS